VMLVPPTAERDPRTAIDEQAARSAGALAHGMGSRARQRTSR
jgi:hypothetical protein